MTDADWYARQGPMTDPGCHAEALRALAGDLGALVTCLQGVLIHDAYLHLHGLRAADFGTISRETVAVADRLGQLDRPDVAGPLALRPPARRTVGTCRDYALLVCAALRARGVPARVRCGFATYFVPGRFADHWVAEYLPADGRDWRLVDAQLDGAHRRALSIDFAPQDVPRGVFLTAAEAWQSVRAGTAEAARFGHGEATGAWFLTVNLARDLLSLCKQETSPWDAWREAGLEHRTDRPETYPRWDRVAEAIRAVDRDRAALEALAADLRPFWD